MLQASYILPEVKKKVKIVWKEKANEEEEEQGQEEEGTEKEGMISLKRRIHDPGSLYTLRYSGR